MPVPGTPRNEFRDDSGLITVAVFERRAGTPQQHFDDFAVGVPNDMVVIGGGAEGAESPFGALLTASYPNGQLDEWVASSKDHGEGWENPHQLTVWAVGMRINGLTRDELRANLTVSIAESGLASHPEASVSVPGGFVLLGGGFIVAWQAGNPNGGNLATASFPETNQTWKARSKDHFVASPANLSVYAIGIRENIVGKKVDLNIVSATSGSSQHPSQTVVLTPGYALTGGGAEVHWSEPGNLLWRLKPTTQTAIQDFSAASKDHGALSPATITTYALGIRLV